MTAKAFTMMVKGMVVIVVVMMVIIALFHWIPAVIAVLILNLRTIDSFSILSMF